MSSVDYRGGGLESFHCIYVHVHIGCISSTVYCTYVCILHLHMYVYSVCMRIHIIIHTYYYA